MLFKALFIELQALPMRDIENESFIAAAVKKARRRKIQSMSCTMHFFLSYYVKTNTLKVR
jgi:hypothetical protein